MAAGATGIDRRQGVAVDHAVFSRKVTMFDP
jgi:hypothetical protein